MAFFTGLGYGSRMKAAGQYYVYCYIDPRNLEEFYYGKGTGSRSKAHLLDQGRSEKAARIKQIRAAGVEPTIRVIATGLSEEQAFWTESALLWKLGKRLTNKVRGRDVAKFRPPDTMHANLIGFDYAARIHFFNVGEQWGERSWDDCSKHGFISAGYGPRYRDAIRQLHKGDLIFPYVSRVGYVGIGTVIAEAVPCRDFRVRGLRLSQLGLKAPRITHDAENMEKCEYVAKIRWHTVRSRAHAFRARGIFTSVQTRASLANQPQLLKRLESEWDVEIHKLLENSAD